MPFTTVETKFPERTLFTMAMHVMFRPVQGWKDTNLVSMNPFTITGIDGSDLEALLVKTPDPSPKGIVVLCHPFLKYGMSYFLKNEFTQELNKAGMHVLLFNFKGFGRSTISGPCFADDVLSAVQWVKVQFPNLDAHLMGFSFGGFHGLHALSRIDGSVRSATFDSVPPMIGNFFHKGLLGHAMRYLSNSKWGSLTGTAPIIKPLGKIRQTRVQLIFGDTDPYCNSAEREALRGTGPFGMKVFEQSAHLQAYRNRRAEYLKHVTAFVLAK